MKDPDQASDRLRRAEELLAGRSEKVRNLSPDEIRAMIHELHLHQIELEMQDEELRRAQEELEASGSRAAGLADALLGSGEVPIGVTATPTSFIQVSHETRARVSS